MKRVAGNLADAADHRAALNLDERADPGRVADAAAVEVDELRVVDDHAVAENDIATDHRALRKGFAGLSKGSGASSRRVGRATNARAR